MTTNDHLNLNMNIFHFLKIKKKLIVVNCYVFKRFLSSDFQKDKHKEKLFTAHATSHPLKRDRRSPEKRLCGQGQRGH